MSDTPDLGQVQKCSGVKHVFLRSQPLPLANADKKQNLRHDKM